METIKLFTFITILLLPTIVSPTKCKNQEVQCIELCCKVTQYYEQVSEECKDIPGSDGILWDTLLYDNNTMSEKISGAVEFVEFGECEASDDPFAVIPFCYSPFYQTELKQFGIRNFSDVPCYRIIEFGLEFDDTVSTELQYISSNNLIAASYVGTLFICLSIMVIYTCRKGLKGKFIFILFSWYLVSMSGYLVAEAVGAQVSLESDVLWAVLIFSYISSWQWLNVIGFQMWSGYKKANAQYNSQNNQRRFMCYSIYAWGVSAILTSMHLYKEYPWNFIEAKWIENASMIFNLVTFLVLSLNICRTRCAVANLTTETRFKRRLACIILRLGLMMGFPRILFTIFQLYVKSGQIVLTVFLTLEPFLMFILLLWKPKNYFNWNLICCCCRSSEGIPNSTEVEIK